MSSGVYSEESRGLSAAGAGRTAGSADSEALPAIELSFVMPCLNEAETLATCIEKARNFLATSGISGEIVVADNGSSDGSQAIAAGLGARVIAVPIRGYGAALQAGIAAARGRFVIMGDADDSYDFGASAPFVEKLRGGAQLVMGNRFKGKIEDGAMPFLNRYLGNPVLSFIGRLFFRIPIGDFHCGLRGFVRQDMIDLDLHTTGMEYASEMVVRAAIAGLRIAEVPTTLAVDGRSRKPHLRPWRDGWRHLRFLLLFSPRWLFFYPGLVMTGVGLLILLLLWSGPSSLPNGIKLDVHTMLVGSGILIVGLQSVCFSIIARQYAAARHLLPPPMSHSALIGTVTLERLAVSGTVILVLGAIGLIYAMQVWGAAGFGEIGYIPLLRPVILSVTALIAGAQLILSGFLSGVIAIGQRD